MLKLLWVLGLWLSMQGGNAQPIENFNKRFQEVFAELGKQPLQYNIFNLVNNTVKVTFYLGDPAFERAINSLPQKTEAEKLTFLLNSSLDYLLKENNIWLGNEDVRNTYQEYLEMTSRQVCNCITKETAGLDMENPEYGKWFNDKLILCNQQLVSDSSFMRKAKPLIEKIDLNDLYMKSDFAGFSMIQLCPAILDFFKQSWQYQAGESYATSVYEYKVMQLDTLKGLLKNGDLATAANFFEKPINGKTLKELAAKLKKSKEVRAQYMTYSDEADKHGYYTIDLGGKIESYKIIYAGNAPRAKIKAIEKFDMQETSVQDQIIEIKEDQAVPIEKDKKKAAE